MELIKLEKLVALGESDETEFKKSTGQLCPAFETICAFLNSKGGLVLIGVTNEQRIIGQQVSDSTRQNIAKEINKIEPHAEVNVQFIPFVDGKFIIILQVERGVHAPYLYDGRAYVRTQSTTVRMSQHRYEQLLVERGQLNHSWEKLITKKYPVNYLDRNLILGVIRKAVESKRLPEEALRQDIFQVLEALQLSHNGELINATIVLFGTKLLPDYPQCQLKMARFKGIDRHEFLDSDLVYGNVFELLEKGTLFIKRHLPVAAKVIPGKLERVETPLIPFNATREALINSLCHRDYSIYGGSIGLGIYDDRMEIFNDGGLPQGVTIEKIKTGFSKPRNHLIADILFRCNLIEKWGRGIQEIIRSCMAAGDPEPEFFTDQVEFKVIFRFPKTINPMVRDSTDKQELLTDRQRKILEILTKSGELNIKDIHNQLHDDASERTLRRDLVKLRNLGLIQMHGRANRAAWIILR